MTSPFPSMSAGLHRNQMHTICPLFAIHPSLRLRRSSLTMSKCDICSLPLAHEQMKILTGRAISAATENGFLPKHLVEHSLIMQGYGAIFGQPPPSDSSLWRVTV